MISSRKLVRRPPAKAVFGQIVRRFRARQGILAALVALVITSPNAVFAGGPLGLPDAPPATDATRLTITWFGVATLLFDDGETQFLVDGFFSRPSQDSLTSQDDAARIAPDVDQIERQIKRLGIQGLAAITPVHSHFDHAMDLGVIAKRTNATVLGSESTANIARGAGVAEERIQVLEGDAGTYNFGAFEIVLIRSAHAPLVDGGPPIPGSIESPLVPPAALTDWKEGGSYSVVVRHPAGSALVQGSAGFVPGALDAIEADVVLLGIGGLNLLGEEHTARYWAEIVEAVAPRCVVPIHWDNFWQPFGTIVLGSQETLDAFAWFDAGKAGDAGPALLAPQFGVGMDLFGSRCGSGGTDS